MSTEFEDKSGNEPLDLFEINENKREKGLPPAADAISCSLYQPLLKDKLTISQRMQIYKMLNELPYIGRTKVKLKASKDYPIVLQSSMIILEYNYKIFKVENFKNLQTGFLLANFTLKLVQINVEADSDTLRTSKKKYVFHVITKTNVSNPIRMEFTGEELSNQCLFKRKLATENPALVLYSQENEFAEIITRILDIDVPTCVVFKNLGYNKEYNFWIYSNAIIDISNMLFGYLNNKTGEIEFADGRKYIVKTDLNETFLPIFNKYTAISEAKKFFENLIESEDDPAILLCFGIVLGIVYIDIFFEKTRGYPSVLLQGNAQVGKSTWQKVWSYMYGFKNGKNIKSATSTGFSIRKTLSRLNNIPAQFDEISKEKIDLFSEIAKDSYSQVPRERGSASGDIERIEVHTAPVMSSNFFFNDISEPIITRFIFSCISDKNPKLMNFRYFSSKALENLSMILPLFIFCRPLIYEIYTKELKTLSKIINSGQRYAHNIAISLSVWSIIFSLIGNELFDKYRLVNDYLKFYTPYLDMNIQFGDAILSHLGHMIVRNFIDYNDVYTLTKNRFVRLNLTKFRAVYNMLYPRQQLSRNQLVLGLKSDKRFRLESSDIKPVGRAIFVDLSENEELLELIQEHRSRRGNNG